nr:potassium-transporting ATPase subunit KdpC [uncultured Niameybacter sp.]
MLKSLKEVLTKSMGLLIIFTVFCGFVYPVGITGVSQILFKNKANGSMIEIDGKKYGSTLLAQQFTGDEYMWGRIMNIDVSTFTDEEGKPVMYGIPSNLSTASKEYEVLVAKRVERIKEAHPYANNESIPVDLVTSSGSGLDPHISLAAANYQAERIARARGIESDKIEEIIKQCTQKSFLGLFGENVVNVLEVNLMLDGILS